MTAPATARPIVSLLDYQRRAIESPARFTSSNWSRQIGKSFTFALKRLRRCLDTGRLQVLLSAGERQSRELMDKVQMHCRALKAAAEFREDTFFEGMSIKQLELRLPMGRRIIALPANPMTARGFTGDVFLDEFAMHRDDREIWAALFPTIMRGRGELDVASTPKGKSNVFYKLQSNEQFERTTVTIHDAVRDGLDVDVDEVRAALDDEELFRQEFECEFVDEAEAFLTFEMIAACEDDRSPSPVIVTGSAPVLVMLQSAISSIDELGDCFLGVDIGRRRDRTVFWLVERVGRELVTRLVIELDRVAFRQQWDILAGLLNLRNVRRCAIDASGLGMQMAEAAVEQFGAWKVDAVTFSASVKAKLAGQLRVRVEDRSIRIPVSHVIRNDWHSIAKIVTTGGNVLYRADRTPDGHADRFWAAGLAVDAAGTEHEPWRGEVHDAGRPQWGRSRGLGVRPGRERSLVGIW